MKRISLLSLLIGIALSGEAQRLQALTSWSAFHAPGAKSYIETYISIDGRSVNQVQNKAGNYEASVQVLIQIALGDKYIYTDKFNMLSPECKDPKAAKAFINQQRIPLPEGDYTLKIELTDNQDPKNYAVVQDKLSVHFNDSLAFSDLTFLESYKKSNTESAFTKNGMELIPYPDNLFLTDQESLKFYIELYNADKALNKEPFVINYAIQNNESGAKLVSLSKFSRQLAQPVNVLLNEFPLTDLPSGNYNLVIEVLNKQGQVQLEKQVFFQRINKNYVPSIEDLSSISTNTSFVGRMNATQLQEYINYLRPISSPAEVNYEQSVRKENNLLQMQQFFLYFWQKRDATDPEQAWLKYEAEVNKVNELYSTQLSKGYTTDRGRVYLQYGPPSFVNKSEFDRNTWPYEIWQFNKAARQTNRMFVFSLNNRGLSTDDYQLIHSDVRGELNNPQWQNDLRKLQYSLQQLQQMRKTNEDLPTNINFGDDNLKRDSDF